MALCADIYQRFEFDIHLERCLLYVRTLQVNGMSSKLIYQFRVALLDIETTIWRRLQVPYDYSFWNLHVMWQSKTPWGGLIITCTSFV